ncbi:fasciculation and elongation protein zeta-2-like isoform X2 [Xiphophorus maculatus]|uniref:fasciculation and elongation protein zeta-2-like isoform X2 n=1 Tax=Xiphophorus maculatus TaxID=8083 RepID=UPI000C6E3FD9|nr:fasciculation and elongation protein zeta-2-like isoform X2 [Xiphophorus maculatus]
MVRAMDAPIAHFDDDRPNLADVTAGSVPQHGRAEVSPAAGEAVARLLLDQDDPPGRADSDGSPKQSSVCRSTEEHLNGPDGKLSACLENVKPDRIGAVSVFTEETLLEKDEIWNALACNYGQAVPVDWRQSRTRSLYISTFNLEERLRETDDAAELSDEDELREQLDMHSIIVPCVDQEPLVTAEQVIEEIEEMMQDSPDAEAERNPSQSDLSMLSVDIRRSSPGFEDSEWPLQRAKTGGFSHKQLLLSMCVMTPGLRSLSAAELLERLTETEVNIRRFSEELVQQLAVRDELDFEKEVKNSFISALIDVQNRQKEHRESLRKKKKLKGGAGAAQGLPERTPGSRFSMDGLSSVIQNSFRQTFGSGCSERQYLTTVIPYEKKGLPPSIEDLQILTKILQAMRDDSDKVPGLLTDYILNVFCPT